MSPINPEQEPARFTQRLVEGINIHTTFERVVDGVRERFYVSIGNIKRRDDGVLVGTIDAVDEFALEYVQDLGAELPEEIDLVDGETTVISHEDDAEEPHKHLVSPKVAAIIGGATVAGAGAVVVNYFIRHNRRP